MISQSCKKVRILISAELSSLWRFALHITHDKSDAEDLVQRTCLRALERCESYRDMEKPQSWLFRIAHNIWKNELRSRNLRDSRSVKAHDLYKTVDTISQQSDNQTPEANLEFREVVLAVKALPEAQRLVMILIAVDGFSYAEAASILDVPIGTVMSRLARARLSIGQQFMSKPHDQIRTKNDGEPRSNSAESNGIGKGINQSSGGHRAQGISEPFNMRKPQ